MAERVQLKVDLEANLGKVVEATKSLKLDKGQTERLEKYRKGAELAYANGDLKTFQKNFNNVVKLFKEAASVTGKVSEEIKKLTDKQSALNQEINRLKDKKTSLEGKLTKDRSRITVKAAREFAGTSADAKKVLTGNGKVATRDEIIELQKALADFLVKTGKTISQVKNEDLKDIKTSSGLTFGSRNAMFAANRYVKAEGEYEESVKTDLIGTENQIQTETNNYTELSNELKRMSEAAKDGADDISKLYAEISKLGDDTNKEITDAVNEEKINKTDRTGATQGVGDLKTLEKQTSGLGKAFKQFTIYNIALRAVKTALREAVQTIKELDKYLTEQAMVTGMTREQTYGLVKSYQDLALQCGATTKEIAEVSTEYMKQGKTIQESLVLTEAAVKAAKVARVSVGDSVNYLTTALNGFQLSAEDAMKVSDKFAAVAAASATDYDELAIALSKVASQANLAGMSIDYTTALLTKGLETTREAPETMGTALKTIIARMRELSDYGETLEGDTDINNVESQLAYVGIALRDANGELRSTEDVLDELGKKWDTLNKNQQAALAKALAGTRQQSRLIALMDDYERVTELQEISARSAGATSAQAATYLEGIEASMNKIQVAWEKIVMTVSDSEIIIGVFDWIGDSLNNIGEFLSTDWGVFTGITLVAMYAASIVTSKIEELAQQKLINIENLKAKQIDLEKQKTDKENKKLLLDERAQNAKILRDDKKKVALAAKKAKIKATESKLEKGLISEAQAKLEIEQADLEYKTEKKNIEMEYSQSIREIDAERKILNTEINALDADIAANMLEQTQTGSTMLSIFGSFIPVISTIISLMSLWSTIQSIVNAKKTASIGLTKKQAKEEGKAAAASAGGMFAQIVKAFSSGGIPGVIAGIAVATAAVAGILALVGLAGMGISIAIKSIKKDKSAEAAAEDINKLSAEIYKLNEKAQAIEKITNSFDKLDNKLIKTKADLEEMNSLLEQGAEAMDDTNVDENEDIGFGEGRNEKDFYNSLDDQGKRLYLNRRQDQIQKDLDQKRQEQKNRIEGLSEFERARLLDDTSTDAKIIEAQSAIYALNNAELYKRIDLLKENGDLTESAAQATEQLTQSLLEGLNAEEAWEFTQHPEKIIRLTNAIADLKTEATNAAGKLVELSTAEVLASDDYSLTDRVEAYKEIVEELVSLGDTSILDSFLSEYSGFEVFSHMSKKVLKFVDDVGLSTDEINKLWGAWENLQKDGVGISQEVWESRFDEYIEILAATQGDVLAATKQVFGDYLGESEENLNAFITAYGDLVQLGILNMGQNMDKVKNSINSFYEKALEWNKMSESDRAEFLQDNADLFAGEGGDELLKAFESGNYNEIEKALQENDALQKQIEQRKKEVEQELLIERARIGEDRNEAYIAELERYQEYLNDAENMFKASLEVRLEQEQEQLDEYRSYLEEQQDALEDSLNKRKDAYQKYFDSINQNEEDENYEEQADLLINNLNKLSSTNNASAEQKTKELEKQLEELEKERLKELRERAQEAILENMDDELAAISEKFDKLLESNQALLAAMQGDLEDPGKFISNMVTEKIASGATALETESYIDSLKSTYGSVLGDKVDWDVLKETINQLFLNVNGQTINMTSEEEQNVFNVIMSAITGIGKR